MAFSIQEYTGDGSTKDFAVTFNYLDASHIRVSVSGVVTTDPASLYSFTMVNSTTVRIVQVADGTSPVPSGAPIKVYRETPIANPAVVWPAGAALTTADLNKLATYLTYSLQESLDANAGATVATAAADRSEAAADESEASATAAASSASSASTSATNAANSATASANSATSSSTSAANSANSATLASRWAEEADGVDVNGVGTRSAKHWANAAAASAASINPNSIDINGGTIDGTTIGAATPSTGRFTTVTTTGNVGIGTSSPALKTVISNNGAAGLELDPTSGLSGGALVQAYNRSGGVYTHLTVDAIQHIFRTSGSERMRIDSAGNVGIGTTAPTSPLHVFGAGSDTVEVESSTTTGSQIVFRNAGTEAYSVGMTGAVASNFFIFDRNRSQVGYEFLGGSSGYHKFHTNGVERMRILSDGSIGIGSTATVPNPGLFIQNNGRINFGGVAGSNTFAGFYAGTTNVGSITTNGTTTAYSTSSDYRLKEDLQPISEATERLLALNPVNFAWKADGTRVDGFLAHEVQEVVPEAVTGTKDAVDAEGNPEYQAIDHSKLVPLLTASLQDALKKIEALEARVAALEAANA